MKLRTKQRGFTLVEGNRVSRSCVPKQSLGTRRSGRPGFTLVEMLVATALVMFIMLILSEAFVAGLEAFRTLKGIGDMEERLRAAALILRNDLEHDHFGGGIRLGDQSYWKNGKPNQGFVNVTQGYYPVYSTARIGPGAGQTVTPVNSAGASTMQWYTWSLQPRTVVNGVTFPGTTLLVDTTGTPEIVEVLTIPSPTTFTANFILNHPNAPITIRVIRQPEGVDADLLPISRATDHILHMAVLLPGDRQENFFTAHVPQFSPLFPTVPNPAPPPLAVPNPNYTPTSLPDQSLDSRFQDLLPMTNPAGYKTPWAEVAYFLWPNGSTAGGTPLFALYRAEFKVVPDNRYVNGKVYNPPVPPPILFTPGTGWNPLSSTPAGDGYDEMCARANSTTIGGTTYNYYYFPSPTSLASITSAGQPDRTFSYFYDPTQGRVAAGAAWPFDPNKPEVWSATLVATDVVSFDVQILSRQLDQQLGLPDDFYDLQTGVFDTANAPGYSVDAIRIILRVWNMKTNQTRQVSIIQQL